MCEIPSRIKKAYSSAFSPVFLTSTRPSDIKDSVIFSPVESEIKTAKKIILFFTCGFCLSQGMLPNIRTYSKPNIGVQGRPNIEAYDKPNIGAHDKQHWSIE